MKRILCLHGKQQNKSTFRTKLGRLPSKLKNLATFTIIDAPFDCDMSFSSTPDPPETTAEAVHLESIGKTWYHRDENGEVNRKSLEHTLNYLQDIWRTDGPFDGIFGFSMGGTVAALMCSKQYIDHFSGVQFIICVGSPHVSPILDDCTISSDIISLHIAGDADIVVSKERSIMLANLFCNPVVHIHPLGHCVPMKAEYLTWFSAFVEGFSRSN